jgi:hypothetical protein
VSRGVPDPERAAPGSMDTTPRNQGTTFRNQNQAWPHRVIRRGDAVRPIPPHARFALGSDFEVATSAAASSTTWPAAARPGS